LATVGGARLKEIAAKAGLCAADGGVQSAALQGGVDLGEGDGERTAFLLKNAWSEERARQRGRALERRPP